MTNEPETFTTSVPQGKVSPKRLAIRPDTPHRARLPSPPPMNIHNAFHINPTLPQVAAWQELSALNFQAVYSRCGRRQTPLPANTLPRPKCQCNPIFHLQNLLNRFEAG